MKVTTVEKHIEEWLEQFIVSLNLCPFAKKPWQLGQIKIRSLDSGKEEDLTRVLLEELSLLVGSKRNEIETTLLVHPYLLEDFDDFLSYLEWAIEELLEKSGVQGLVQIVGFHPDYYFEGSTEDDQANFTNRSPFPLIHLLREESVEEAVEYYPNIDEIPNKNIELLKKMKLADLKRLCLWKG